MIRCSKESFKITPDQISQLFGQKIELIGARAAFVLKSINAFLLHYPLFTLGLHEKLMAYFEQNPPRLIAMRIENFARR